MILITEKLPEKENQELRGGEDTDGEKQGQ